MNAKEIAKIRKQINRSLTSLPTFHNEIPFSTIQNILAQSDLKLVQEDGTPYSGFFCGADGDARIDVVRPNTNVKFGLRLMWHTMQSGRYEITVYVM